MRWITLLLLFGMTSWCNEVTAVSSDPDLDSLLPETKHVNGTQLTRNGVGIRSLSLFGMPIKVYTAGFYTLSPLRDWEAVQECNGPKHMEFTFLRSVGQGQVTNAWRRQLEASVTHTYDGYEQDRDTFIRMFGAIVSGGTMQIHLSGEETHVVDQGKHKGVISGRNFQRAFLSMWFGEKAVQESLKSGLLGVGTHEQIAAAVC